MDGQKADASRGDVPAIASIGFKSATDFVIYVPKGLDAAFVSLFDTLAVQINPFDQPSSDANLRASADGAEPDQGEVPIANAEATLSRFKTTSALNKDGSVQFKAQAYNL